jgi:disulfide bond formation protein DsbB
LTSLDTAGSIGTARLLALVVPASLLAGAYGFQYFGGLPPCEMCWWQRYGHMAAIAFAILAFLLRGGGASRSFVILAALAIFASGAVGAYHAGVELDIFEGFTQCTSAVAGGSAADMLDAIMNAPIVRCDEVPWSFLGISMAGWNAILSIGFASLILWLATKRPGSAA